jgi:fused signal recognition particle receptor
MSWLKKLTAGLKKSSDKVTTSLSGISRLFSKDKIDAASIEEIEEALILADLGVSVAADIAEGLRAHKFEGEVTPEALRHVLAQHLTQILAPVEKPLAIADQDGTGTSLHVILLVGVNGSGKTTTAGKLAARFQAQGKKVVMAAADTFRAAAIEQLAGWGLRTDTHVISGERGGDAAALAFRAIDEARADKADVLIIDTAGRLQNRAELMEELAKIIRVIKKQIPEAPHDSLIVLDGTVGQNAIAQMKAFQQTADLTGMVITKLDGSAKGGIVVALAREFGLPVHMVGVGESAEDLQDFTARDFAYALVGLDPEAPE